MISSEQRVAMINDLRSKVELWQSTDPKEKFNKNLPSNPTVPLFGTERTNNGYYYYSDVLVSFCDLNNGQIFRLRKDWQPQDWNCYSELYAKGQELGSFRIDIPLIRDTISIGNDEWEYGELQSPGENYGKNFNDDVFSWPVLEEGRFVSTEISEQTRADTEVYFKDFVDQATAIMQQANLIAVHNNCGLPFDLCYIINRYTDDQGVFWSDVDKCSWSGIKENVIEDSLLKFRTILGFAKLCGVLDDAKLESVYNRARTKWTAI